MRTIVFLLRGDDPPDLSEAELDHLQARHLAYGTSLFDRGFTVANGPFTEQSDTRFRGMAVYTVGRDQAYELASQDPSVLAGRLKIEVARWWTGAGRVGFPLHGRPVGDRFTIDDM